LKYLKTTLEPSKLLMWRNQMQSRIRYKADSVAEYKGIADACFTLSSDEWLQACLEPTEHGARCSEFNSYLAEGLHGSFDDTSCHVTWLRHCLSERGAAAMLDGRLMLDLIADHTFGASAAELQRREVAFKAKVFFKDSMSGPEARAAYTEFIAEHRLLPDHAQGGPFQAHHDLISKLPPCCHVLREKYSRRMYHEQARRYSAPTISLKDILELAIVDMLRGQGHGVNALSPLVEPLDAILAAGGDQRQRSGPGRGVRSRACTAAKKVTTTWGVSRHASHVACADALALMARCAWCMRRLALTDSQMH
jgi:hypothetical protein